MRVYVFFVDLFPSSVITHSFVFVSVYAYSYYKTAQYYIFSVEENLMN